MLRLILNLICLVPGVIASIGLMIICLTHLADLNSLHGDRIAGYTTLLCISVIGSVVFGKVIEVVIDEWRSRG